MRRVFVRFLGKSSARKKSFRDYLTFNSEDGNAQLSMACLYVVVGLALVSMAINLMQDTIRNKVIELAMDLGIIDDPSLDEDED